jgi:Ca-activated chloride channel family protein
LSFYGICIEKLSIKKKTLYFLSLKIKNIKIMKTKIFTAIIIAILFCGVSYSQSIIVTGTVSDGQTGEALIGVSVVSKKKNTGSITDINGAYIILVDKGDILTFLYIGYKKQEIKIKDNRKIDVQLEPDTQMLYETVVTGYGTQLEEKTAGLAKRNKRLSKQMNSYPAASVSYDAMSTEEYNSFKENKFILASSEALSTFSIDVDAAAYSNFRRHVNQGQLPPKDAVRVEEFINYFSYDYEQPNGKDPVKISTETGECPWNNQHRLVRIGVKAKEIAGENLPASNFVFLIDVSGSMYGPTRLDLVKSSMKLLVNNLREKDKVAIVVYSGRAGEVLPSTSGADKQKIREALDNLTAGGSTAGGAGIKLAYEIAKKNFIEGGNNRIILCTDGDFNVGVSSNEGGRHGSARTKKRDFSLRARLWNGKLQRRQHADPCRKRQRQRGLYR